MDGSREQSTALIARGVGLDRETALQTNAPKQLLNGIMRKTNKTPDNFAHKPENIGLNKLGHCIKHASRTEYALIAPIITRLNSESTPN